MTNQTDKNSTCVNIKDSPFSDLLMGIYIVAFVLGIIFNLLTCWPIIQQIRSNNVLGVYLLSLSISDLLYILTMPLWIYYYHHDHKWKLGHGWCRLAGFFYYSNMYISIYLLCCISIDRCLVVTFPLKVKAFRRYRYAWVICGFVYLVVMTLHLLVLSMDDLKDSLDPQDHCYETYPMTERVALFNLLRVAIGFLLPLLVLAVCYWRILSKVKKSIGVDEQGKRKVKLLSVGVIAIFSICFAPYHILLFARSVALIKMDFQDYCVFEQAQHLYFSCCLALSSLNSVMDPLLYVLVSNGIREDIRMFCRKNGKNFWHISVRSTRVNPTTQETNQRL